MVNVNTVYTTVLQILNKEQRGYVTPQEFNNLAQQVQLEIFESYFPDGTQLNRQNQNNTQNNTEFFNIFKNQNEKIFPFIKDLAFFYDAITQLVTRADYNKITRSKLTAPTEKFPIAFASTKTVNPLLEVGFTISPQPSSVSVNCIVAPSAPIWAFTQTPGTGQYIYSPARSNSFSLVYQEQTNIIMGILKYAGVIINDPTIIDLASQEVAQVQANEKS